MLYKSYLLVYTLTFTDLWRNVHGELTRETVLENFVAGFCKRGENDVILKTSYIECIEECRARSECISVSVLTRGSLCRLHFNDADDKIVCNFYVYAEKTLWKQKFKAGCESVTCATNQKCEISGGQAACITKECRRITSLDNGIVYGNDVRNGKKMFFRCKTGNRLIGNRTLKCGEDGEWSASKPTCSDAPPPLTNTPAQTTVPADISTESNPENTTTATVSPDLAFYNQSCSDDVRCLRKYLECRDDLCRCAFGRRFNPYSNINCTYSCNFWTGTHKTFNNGIMGTSFQTHTNKWLEGVNGYLLNKSEVDNIEACTYKCTQIPNCHFAMVEPVSSGASSCTLYQGNPFRNSTIVDARHKSLHFRDCGLTGQVDPTNKSTQTTSTAPKITKTTSTAPKTTKTTSTAPKTTPTTSTAPKTTQRTSTTPKTTPTTLTAPKTTPTITPAPKTTPTTTTAPKTTKTTTTAPKTTPTTTTPPKPTPTTTAPTRKTPSTAPKTTPTTTPAPKTTPTTTPAPNTTPTTTPAPNTTPTTTPAPKTTPTTSTAPKTTPTTTTAPKTMKTTTTAPKTTPTTTAAPNTTPTTTPELQYNATCSPNSGIACSNSNLTCRDGYCACVFGHVYNPTTRNCVTSCTAYGRTFQTHYNTAITSSEHLAFRTVYQKDAQLCLDTCRTNGCTMVWAYQLSGQGLWCYFYKVAFYTLVKVTNVARSSIFLRDCAIIEDN